MSRRTFYLPDNKSGELPSNCIWFDTETNYELHDDGYEHHTLWFGYACYRQRIKDNEWSEPEWFRFTGIDQFWQWVYSKTRAKTRLYLFAHNGAFDLPVMDAFTQLPLEGYEMTFAVVEAPPMIVNWKKDDRTIKFVDTLNIWRLPLALIGDQLGFKKLTMPKSKKHSKKWEQYGKRDTEIIMEACIRWFQFLRDYDMGGFATTLASQSMNAYRHRFMTDKLLIHDNEAALKMERNAYTGGRTECFYIGKYTGRFYHLDINSMYPAIMRDNVFPIKFMYVYKRMSLMELQSWMGSHCVIAEVDIETKHNHYPKVMDGRLVFPTGRLSTTVTTPELIRILEHDELIRLKRVAVYEQSTPFTNYIDVLYNERLKARQEGRDVDAWNLKIFMNSLYGKFGQRGRQYEIIDNCDIAEIEVWSEVDIDDGTLNHYRKFGGKVSQYFDNGESRYSMPAIAAHVTAYARMLLAELIDLATPDNVFYVDTDCLVVNQSGYDKLKSVIDEDCLGKLKIEGSYKNIQLNSPKDYQFDDVVKMKGVRKNAKKINHNTFEQVKFVGMAGLLRLGQLNSPLTSTVTKTLRREYHKGNVTPSGKVSPFICSDF